MTWKERRTISMLLTIIAVLFAALLIVFGMRYREGREEALAGADGAAAGLSGGDILADPGAYSALSYYNGSVTLSFTLDEKGNWVWADGPDFPLNSGTVTSILEALTSLKFQQVLAATESREEYGLDNPAATLTASAAGGAEQTLSFGKTTTDGDSYYMMMNGNDSTVYIVADTLVKLMQLPIYDMCALPELPDLNELNLRAITIQGPAPAAEPAEEGDGGESGEDSGAAEEPERPAVSLNARRSNGEDQPALWFDGSDNVTTAPLMQDLLRDLRTMTMAKCVDYYPSDEALEICGFQNPDAILKVEYAAGGMDQTFTLWVGARMPDESGRYVQLEENGPIYALSTDCADAIMTISVNGVLGTVQDSAQEGDNTGE